MRQGTGILTNLLPQLVISQHTNEVNVVASTSALDSFQTVAKSTIRVNKYRPSEMQPESRERLRSLARGY
jgi:hypothetical protein